MRKSKIVSEIDSMALMGVLSTQVLSDLYIGGFNPLRNSEIKEGRVMNSVGNE